MQLLLSHSVVISILKYYGQECQKLLTGQCICLLVYYPSPVHELWHTIAYPYVVPLYKALVRSHLEYCSLVWSPYLKKNILSIEHVQRRVTKMIPSISALTYEERLKRTGLISVENRRLRADLLVLKGSVKVDPAAHFSMSDRRSREHTQKLEKPRARLELRKQFHSNRVIDAWNALPVHMVEATSTYGTYMDLLWVSVWGI